MVIIVATKKENVILFSGIIKYLSGKRSIGKTETIMGIMMSESDIFRASFFCFHTLEKLISKPVVINKRNKPSHPTVSIMFCCIASIGKSFSWNAGKTLPKIVGPKNMPMSMSEVTVGCFILFNKIPKNFDSDSMTKSCIRNKSILPSFR
jgi:hypothetical protein